MQWDPAVRRNSNVKEQELSAADLDVNDRSFVPFRRRFWLWLWLRRSTFFDRLSLLGDFQFPLGVFGGQLGNKTQQVFDGIASIICYRP
jgi:hypothetical protein